MGESIKRIVGSYQDSYSPNGIIGEKDACGVGFVAHVKGIESNWILKQSLKGLNCMEHRGGCGGDSDSGDGAGILCSIPWKYLEEKISQKNTQELHRGLGMIFMPNNLPCLTILLISLLNIYPLPRLLAATPSEIK